MSAVDASTPPAALPAPPTLEASGLTLDLVVQLALKTLHFAGTLTGLDLSRRLGVAFPVVEPALEALKNLRHVEIVGAGVIGGPTYRYRITDAGRERAALFLDNNHYVGVAPVPVDQYRRYMTEFRDHSRTYIDPEKVRSAFSHLVLSQRVLDQIGPAVCAGHSLFVYGPPGNGKTVISQAIRNLLDGDVLVPHALEIEGSIVRVFDPVSHEPVAATAAEAEGLDRDDRFDARWVRCRRPMITVGGELTLDSLELAYSPATGFYRAPLQVAAGGGVLVVDDFGRQHASPRDLLNRWIVPLESRVDYLTLQTGQKCELPFAVMVIFATNIRPAELVDEAFLRRIQYKVFAENPTERDFATIFARYCASVDVPFEQALVDHLLAAQVRPRRIQIRGCQPRDLINHALALADYHGEPRLLTTHLLDAACDSYFVDDRGSASDLAHAGS